MMIEVKGDIWKAETDLLCLTTNGFVTKKGLAVMGRGNALEAQKHVPNIKKKVGDAITANGNRVQMIVGGLAIFPVKSVSGTYDGSNVVPHMKKHYRIGDFVPGFALVADKEIIRRSCKELVKMIENTSYKHITIPRPGCGAGMLKYEDIKPILEEYLDDRFHIYTYPDDEEVKIDPKATYLIIAGSRSFHDYNILERVMDSFIDKHDFQKERLTIVSGTAKGADALGEKYASSRGYGVLRMPAKWDKYGKPAGMIRNNEMAMVSQAAVIFIENNSRGSMNMAKTAIEKKLIVGTVRV